MRICICYHIVGNTELSDNQSWLENLPVRQKFRLVVGALYDQRSMDYSRVRPMAAQIETKQQSGQVHWRGTEKLDDCFTDQ